MFWCPEPGSPIDSKRDNLMAVETELLQFVHAKSKRQFMRNTQNSSPFHPRPCSQWVQLVKVWKKNKTKVVCKTLERKGHVMNVGLLCNHFSIYLQRSHVLTQAAADRHFPNKRLDAAKHTWNFPLNFYKA